MVILDEKDGEASFSDDEDHFISGFLTGKSNAKTSRRTGKSSSSPRVVSVATQHQQSVELSTALTTPSLAVVQDEILSHSGGEWSSVCSVILPADLLKNHLNEEQLREIRAFTML